MDGYIYLAIAIITQAAEDYRRAYKRKENLQHIERFLLSDYGNIYSFGNGEVILDMLKDECVNGRKNKTKPYLRYGMVARNR